MRTLVNAVVTGFQSRGVPTQSAADREFQAGDEEAGEKRFHGAESRDDVRGNEALARASART